MPVQGVELENDWIVKVILIEAHSIINGLSKGLVCGLCEPEDGIRLVYPRRPTLDEADFQHLTQQEIDRVLSGQLSEEEILAIKSMGFAEGETKRKVFKKIFVEYFYSLMFDMFNLLDGTTDPQLTEAEDECGAWLGAKILVPLPEEEHEFSGGASESPAQTYYGHDFLSSRFHDAYEEFNQLISAEPYVRRKVKNFKDDDTVIKTLMLEAYCKIEIQSRRFMKDLVDLNIGFVYPGYLEKNETGLTEEDKEAVRSIGLESEAVRTVLQKVFAGYCYDVIVAWFSAFELIDSPLAINNLPEQPGRGWPGARISASGYRYPDMLHDAFPEIWHKYNEIISRPPRRPF